MNLPKPWAKPDDAAHRVFRLPYNRGVSSQRPSTAVSGATVDRIGSQEKPAQIIGAVPALPRGASSVAWEDALVVR
jgi:hypothetical protein